MEELINVSAYHPSFSLWNKLYLLSLFRIDEISLMFGGLAVCSLEAVVGRDGKEYIIEVNDSATTLMGESQEEDRKHIAEVVIRQMEEKCKPPAGMTASASQASNVASTTGTATGAAGATPRDNFTRTTSRSSVTSGVGTGSAAPTSSSSPAPQSSAADRPPPPPPARPPPVPPPAAKANSSNPSSSAAVVTRKARARHDSQGEFYTFLDPRELDFFSNFLRSPFSFSNFI